MRSIAQTDAGLSFKRELMDPDAPGSVAEVVETDGGVVSGLFNEP